MAIVILSDMTLPVINFKNRRAEWSEMLEQAIESSGPFLRRLDLERYSAALTISVLMSQTGTDEKAVFLLGQRYLQKRDKSGSLFDVLVVMDRVMERIVQRGTYHHLPFFLGYLRRGLASDDDHSLLAILLSGEQALEGIYKNETCDGAFPSQHSQQAFTVAVAAVLHLLAFVFQYLIGYIDRGGTKTYSSGCFDFRASYVSVLLFLAAFVWIKFRQAARPPTRKRKQPEHPDDANDPSHVCIRKYGPVTKYEARYTIPGNMNKAHPVHPRSLSLGEHKTPEEAAFVSRVAQSYYEGQPGTCIVTSTLR